MASTLRRYQCVYAYKRVSGKWRAQVMSPSPARTTKFLGIFDTQVMAAKAVAKYLRVPLNELLLRKTKVANVVSRPTRTHHYVIYHTKNGTWVQDR